MFALTVALILFFGLMAHINLGTPDSVQRFGSIMVASGILLLMLDRTKFSSARYKFGNEVAFPLLFRVRLVFTFYLPTIIVIEAFLLVCGTLIWGYGDKWSCWLNMEGWVAC